MSSEVKRFYATDYETEYPSGKRGQVLVVKASDYAALEAENARLRSLLNRVRLNVPQLQGMPGLLGDIEAALATTTAPQNPSSDPS